jgi:hypothetical protein
MSGKKKIKSNNFNRVRAKQKIITKNAGLEPREFLAKEQCSGSESGSGSTSTGATCFWASRILLSASKNSNKKLHSYCFVTSFGLFIFEK